MGEDGDSFGVEPATLFTIAAQDCKLAGILFTGPENWLREVKAMRRKLKKEKASLASQD